MKQNKKNVLSVAILASLLGLSASAYASETDEKSKLRNEAHLQELESKKIEAENRKLELLIKNREMNAQLKGSTGGLRDPIFNRSYEEKNSHGIDNVYGTAPKKNLTHIKNAEQKGQPTGEEVTRDYVDRVVADKIKAALARAEASRAIRQEIIMDNSISEIDNTKALQAAAEADEMNDAIRAEMDALGYGIVNITQTREPAKKGEITQKEYESKINQRLTPNADGVDTKISDVRIVKTTIHGDQKSARIVALFSMNNGVKEKFLNPVEIDIKEGQMYNFYKNSYEVELIVEGNIQLLNLTSGEKISISI